MSASTLRKLVVAVGLAAAMLGPTVGTAFADDDHRRHEQREQERDRWERERWEREHHYARPPVVYAQPPQAVYAPPPVVYAPVAPGFNIVLPINIR